ncbi:hypothetical protein BVRB_6g136600 [Beta vulgaris subsp. vulgaris]|nr:hypothetical protein BVRB_6g136600 [Beta vulgaris subsp. vulgaris]
MTASSDLERWWGSLRLSLRFVVGAVSLRCRCGSWFVRCKCLSLSWEKGGGRQKERGGQKVREVRETALIGVDSVNLNVVVPTLNYEPQGDKIWYFFTPRDKRHKNGSRPSRRAKDGYWKATRAEKTIKTNDDQEIGFKNTLVYYIGKNASDGVKTNWIMHEFRINGPSRLGPSLKGKRDMLLDYVLCRIHQNDESGKRSPKKQKTEPVELDEEGNNSSAEEERNNSNENTNDNADADADTDIANTNTNSNTNINTNTKIDIDLNQPPKDNMTGHVEHNMCWL